MRCRIVPTIIASGQEEFDKVFRELEGLVDWVQVDVMDGRFVPNHSNDFGLLVPKSSIKLEAHLMVDEPDQWARDNCHKFDMVIANIERVRDPEGFIGYVKSRGKKVGFALNPETEIDKVMPYIDRLYSILILTVNPGQYGAKFIPETLGKVKALRIFYKGDIEVDGSQVPEIATMSYLAGANVIASGSYIQKSSDKRKAIKEIMDAIDEAK